MPACNSPIAQRRRLAGELRRIRVTEGHTAESVGRAMGWSKSKLSRYELAQGSLKFDDVARLLEFYEVQEDHRGGLLALAEEAAGKGWWEAYSDVLPEASLDCIGLEAAAASIREWQVSVVPALLQAEQYARTVLAGLQAVAMISPRALERRLEACLFRQRLLTRDEPPEYAAVLDESVLHRRRGGPAVMRAQLQQLADICELPNVTVRVLPAAADHGLAVDSFSLFRFADVHETMLPDVARAEHLGRELHVADDAGTHQFGLAFGHLAGGSLSPAESRQAIVAAMPRWDA